MDILTFLYFYKNIGFLNLNNEPEIKKENIKSAKNEIFLR